MQKHLIFNYFILRYVKEKLMIILGIETSCDETAVALYSESSGLIGHKVYSQAKLHARYGGVVPELASRDHISKLLPLFKALIKENNISLDKLRAVAYTEGPGLAGALLVGAAFANSIATALKIPSIGIHHLEGHLLSPFLSPPPPQMPFIALLVSGGHTQLMQVTDIGEYVLLGETLDDAAGEAFDKSAKLLGLEYPGGAHLAFLAETGLPRYRLPRPILNDKTLNFSFSGLKTAVLMLTKKEKLTEKVKADIAASFQTAITEVLVKKTIAALQITNINNLVVAGGVGANKFLRKNLNEAAKNNGFRVFYPALEFCTDNAAMIAYAGYQRFSKNKHYRIKKTFSVRPRWKLQTISQN